MQVSFEAGLVWSRPVGFILEVNVCSNTEQPTDLWRVVFPSASISSRLTVSILSFVDGGQLKLKLGMDDFVQ
jgi:hypothetical protein